MKNNVHNLTHCGILCDKLKNYVYTPSFNNLHNLLVVEYLVGAKYNNELYKSLQ